MTIRALTQSGTVDAFLTLTDRHGNTILWDDSSDGALDAQIATTLPAGSYTLWASSSAPRERGRYTLSVAYERVSACRSVQPVPLGQDVAGYLTTDDCWLESAYYADRWRLDLSWSQRVRIDLFGRDYEGFLIVTDPYGKTIATAGNESGGSSRLDLNLDRGSYIVWTTSALPYRTGSYLLIDPMSTSLVRPLKGVVLALVALLSAAHPASAQRQAVEIGYVRPSGEFAQYSGVGLGIEYTLFVPARSEGRLDVRGGIGALVFEPVADQVCVFVDGAGCFPSLDITTTRGMYYATVGPQVTWTFDAVQPYAHAGLGLSVFESSSAGFGVRGAQGFYTLGVDWTAGGGVSILLGSGWDEDVSLYLGLRHHGGTRARYAPRGELRQDTDGAAKFVASAGRRDVLIALAGIRMRL